MKNPRYMRRLYKRIENYITNNLKEHGLLDRHGNEIFVHTFLRRDTIDYFSLLFELPRQLSLDSTTTVSIFTTPADIPQGIKSATDLEYILARLEDTSASLRSLLNKVKGLQQKGYEGKPYSEKVLLEEMGFKYTVATPTEEDIKRVIDDFI